MTARPNKMHLHVAGFERVLDSPAVDAARAQWRLIANTPTAGPAIRFEDLETVNSGTGTFGRVRLVRHRQTAQSRDQDAARARIVAFQQQRNTMNENILASHVASVYPRPCRDVGITCPYMLLEVVQGGTLHTSAELPPTASLCCYAEYLHRKQVCTFRRKLCDAQGFIRVTFLIAGRKRPHVHLCGIAPKLSPAGIQQGRRLLGGILLYEMLVR